MGSGVHVLKKDLSLGRTCTKAKLFGLAPLSGRARPPVKLFYEKNQGRFGGAATCRPPDQMGGVHAHVCVPANAKARL